MNHWHHQFGFPLLSLFLPPIPLAGSLVLHPTSVRQAICTLGCCGRSCVASRKRRERRNAWRAVGTRVGCGFYGFAYFSRERARLPINAVHSCVWHAVTETQAHTWAGTVASIAADYFITLDADFDILSRCPAVTLSPALHCDAPPLHARTHGTLAYARAITHEERGPPRLRRQQQQKVAGKKRTMLHQPKGRHLHPCQRQRQEGRVARLPAARRQPMRRRHHRHHRHHHRGDAGTATATATAETTVATVATMGGGGMALGRLRRNQPLERKAALLRKARPLPAPPPLRPARPKPAKKRPGKRKR